MEKTMDDKKNAVFTVRDVKETIEELIPLELQEEWDNSGLLIGFEESPAGKILICLELDQRVLAEAKDLGADMIITHHPLIFSGIRAMCDSDHKNKLIMNIIRSGISVYSCHTPFDKVKGGNNDFLMERLGVAAVRNLKGNDVCSPGKMMERKDEGDIGRMGGFKQIMTFGQVIQLAATQLELSIRQLHAVGALDTQISTVGVCTGAGADLMDMAAASDCQLFITGDVKYHEAQKARELGICLLDAGHYGTEKFFAEAMRAKLERKLGDKAELIISGVDLDPFEIL